MAPIHLVGIGLDGVAGLSPAVQHIIQQATVLVGGDRHLGYFPDHPAERIRLGDLHSAIQQIRHRLGQIQAGQVQEVIVILASGDPLFFGFGRLVLAELPNDQITIHPHLSSVQLAFSRIKTSWQDARIISAHGRSLEELTQALQAGARKIAVLTDQVNTPGAIARLIASLDLPTHYQIWVAENLGGEDERVQFWSFDELQHTEIAPLNVVILLQTDTCPLDLNQQPILGIADGNFLSFSDRPGLMTKREVRVQILAELHLQAEQVMWDVGAGTGSVAVEMARLCPRSTIYAIEKTAAGHTLIQQNLQRFQVSNVLPIQGTAPAALADLPNPHRIFIGGSDGNLGELLDYCGDRLYPKGVIVIALATLERLHTVLSWCEEQAHNQPNPTWNSRWVQINVARSVPVGNLTRFAPLNPVTLVTLNRSTPHQE
jgi:precorrin-6Y C5,15-methyltransferase (decarboxylating)